MIGLLGTVVATALLAYSSVGGRLCPTTIRTLAVVLPRLSSGTLASTAPPPFSTGIPEPTRAALSHSISVCMSGFQTSFCVTTTPTGGPRNVRPAISTVHFACLNMATNWAQYAVASTSFAINMMVADDGCVDSFASKLERVSLFNSRQATCFLSRSYSILEAVTSFSSSRVCRPCALAFARNWPCCALVTPYRIMDDANVTKRATAPIPAPVIISQKPHQSQKATEWPQSIGWLPAFWLGVSIIYVLLGSGTIYFLVRARRIRRRP